MALKEITDFFQDKACFPDHSQGKIQVEKFSNWSNMPEDKLLKQFALKEIDTVIHLRIEELTPNFYFTFSLPFLWGASSEVDFRTRVLSTKNGTVLSDIRINRATGGPFNIRPTQLSTDELRGALENLFPLCPD